MTAAAFLAAGLLGSAVLTLLPDPGRSLRRLGETGDDGLRQPAHSWRGLHILGAVVGLIALIRWSLSDLGMTAFALLTGGLVVAAGCQRLLARWRARRLRSARQHAAIELCDALAAELRAGLPAVRAIEHAFEVWPEWSSVVAAARLGGDVAQAMRACATHPGAEGLRATAAAWDVASRSGVALADVLDRVANGLRSDAEARAEVTAALGPPRATAKLLAALPLFGLGLGVSMGAHPVAFLLGSGIGITCLGGGVMLAFLGVLWVEHLADAAEV